MGAGGTCGEGLARLARLEGRPTLERLEREVSNIFRDELAEHGLVISGINPERNLVEVVELPEHRWFLACQYHPEFLSRPYRAHPLFREFIKASKGLNIERSSAQEQEEEEEVHCPA